jgi:hypothetical protein
LASGGRGIFHIGRCLAAFEAKVAFTALGLQTFESGNAPIAYYLHHSTRSNS